MYQYKFGGEGGQTYNLVEAQDLVVVRTKEPKTLETLELSAVSRSLLPNMIPVANFSEANVTVYRCVDKRKSVAVGLRNTVRRNLKQEEGIRFAGRVLKDQRTGQPVIYTENFFLKFQDGVGEEAIEKIKTSYKLIVKEVLPFAKNAFFIEGETVKGTAIFDLATQLLQEEIVECCHPELIRERKHKQIHPMQWHLKASNINGQQINQHVNIEGAWTATRGEGITIAVIDDAVDMQHEEFSTPGKIVAPRNTLLNRDDANPRRSNENHGTCCAGVACANGQFGASGVAPAARLMPIRAGNLGSISEAKAFRWAADNGADVISCSWGPADGPWWDSGHISHQIPFALPDSTRLAIDYALTQGRGGKGCVITWAAGNGNERVDLDGYASYPPIIAVAACNDRGKRSYYSDFGNAIWCCFPSNDVNTSFLPHPRPLTPGIWTTDRMGADGENSGRIDRGDAAGNYYAGFGGTSSACPGVAGVVALMLAVNPDLNNTEVKTIIKNSCDKIDNTLGTYDANGHSQFYGYGRINAQKAVENALNAKAPTAFQVIGVAQFTKAADVPIENGIPQLPNGLPARNRLSGFQLQVVPFHPELSLTYTATINRLGDTGPIPANEFAGTTDRRRKLIGFSIKLTGALAAEYDVHYRAFLSAELAPAIGTNGSLCGTAETGGESIDSIEVSITKK